MVKKGLYYAMIAHICNAHTADPAIFLHFDTGKVQCFKTADSKIAGALAKIALNFFVILSDVAPARMCASGGSRERKG